ncbi:hypothetical protein DIU31_005790 [Mucilaginibacter rubeus]|uniref:Uncharacterized protein n=1 Tax=Mucilaginibacter rubeus TaxID=2027860 RepID=A0AAE6JCA3_9SPHI|nr:MULTISPECIES: hypothetical protein [Mucilaginibacter]QEM03054.1 hypothetical protein DIU31_005790 [Mucilaginibacter rubeus]QEM15673.1 hypothetical protein DIU38_005860 [Mucilaginibacter gossypii]QTE41593.1 hypothetical protein J3L19_21945 [Mucilaginibacter rubeus]QTE48198.1 hypothetical protein J3L21_21935 [Mucilaginibacter rubeus]QTE59587.1 hypothetical protein J3L23_13575 [Mucilaginibacter rubeus]
METFKANMSAVNVCILYSLMVARIAKGYSTADVSFLMGYPDDFIKSREELIGTAFTMSDIQRYHNALEVDGLTGIIFSDLNKKEFSDYQLVKTTEQEVIHHEMFEIQQDKTLKPVFHLFEENPEYKKIKYSNSHQTATKETVGILNLLFEGSLFLSRETPLSIYLRCQSISGSSLNPMHVQTALQDMTKKKGYPKLKRINTKDYGCLYEKAFAKI